MASLTLPRPRLLDRYIMREMVPPTSLGLLVFTFILLIDQIPRLLAILVARSADVTTIFRVFLNLLPSILAVTLPMAFLLGVLLAFGRMASDSEIVALRAVGVSPLRLLAPVLALSLLTGLITFYINAVALPAANQAHRELVFSLLVSKARTVVKPRTFTDDLLPGKLMLYVSDIAADSGVWRNVFIHDNTDPREPKVMLAREGALVIDKEKHKVRLQLGEGTLHTFSIPNPKDYRQARFDSHGFDLPFDEFFPKLPLSKGDREMTLPELTEQIGKKQASGRPAKEWARFAVEWHKKFAIPSACIVFGVLGLGLSLGSKKEARSAAFALSIGVIFVYYIIIRLGEQAGDTGLMSPVPRDVGGEHRAGGGGGGAAGPEPPRGRLRSPGPAALPGLAAPGASEGRGPGARASGPSRSGRWWWCSACPASWCASLPFSTDTSRGHSWASTASSCSPSPRSSSSPSSWTCSTTSSRTRSRAG